MTKTSLLYDSVLYAEEYGLKNWHGATTKRHYYVSSRTIFCKHDKIAEWKVTAV